MALGDSFTEGLWDHDPVQPDVLRGWADLLAATLSARRQAVGEPPLEYANLAVRGRLLPAILSQQVPAALELRPDLVSLVGGGNDVLRPAVDVDVIAAQLEGAVIRLRSLGVDVLLATGMDSVDSPLIRATRARVAVLNSHVWSMARRHGAYVLDVWGMHSLRDWRMWSEDRIHLTGEGHARVAQGALVALGLDPDDRDWDDPLVSLPESAAAERLRGNIEWLRHHVYPWATRRLRRRSDADTSAPKRPETAPVPVGILPGEPGLRRPGDDDGAPTSIVPGLDGGASAGEDAEIDVAGPPGEDPDAGRAAAPGAEPTERTQP